MNTMRWLGRLAILLVFSCVAVAQAGRPLSDSVRSVAARHPGDAGIENDPDVLFADNFESGDMDKWDQRRGRVVMTEDQPNSGRWCVQMPMERGRNHGGDAIKWFMPGADTVYARFYVKFSADYQYCHHFVWLSANQRTNRWSAFGKAGLKPSVWFDDVVVARRYIGPITPCSVKD